MLIGVLGAELYAGKLRWEISFEVHQCIPANSVFPKVKTLIERKSMPIISSESFLFPYWEEI